MVLGKGSNILFSDKGYDGMIIKMPSSSEFTLKENDVYASAGASLYSLAAFCASSSLSGLEFAGGIPGTVGGGIVMNAGAYGGELKDVIKTVTLCDENGNIFTLNNEEMEFGYRKSIVSKKALTVLSAVFSLTPGKESDIRDLMASLNAKRREKQPLNFPSAGSAFKRPEGNYAGALIEQAGLKGFSLGGASVSAKHAGFIVNDNGATSADIYNLIRHVQNTVFESSGIMLEPEIKMIGEF